MSTNASPLQSDRIDSLTLTLKLPMRQAGSAAPSQAIDSKSKLQPAPSVGSRRKPWRPYEAAPRENMTLWWLPRQFYQLRWMLIRNPLAWRTPGFRTHSVGEVLALVVIVAQALWFGLMWAGNVNGYRYDVCVTGAFHPQHGLDVKSLLLLVAATATRLNYGLLKAAMYLTYEDACVVNLIFAVTHLHAVLAGKIAAAMLMLVFFTAMHANSLMLLLLGLPFDRTLPWHKVLALSTTFQGLLHGITYHLANERIVSVAPGSKYWMIQSVQFGSGMEISGVSSKSFISHCKPTYMFES